MADRLDNATPFDDEQDSRGSRHSTGAGAEAMQSTDGEPKTNSQDHESAYGGKAGNPKEPNDIPTSRR